MQHMQKQQSSTEKFFTCFVKIYLNCGFLSGWVLVKVAESFENVADIGTT